MGNRERKPKSSWANNQNYLWRKSVFTEVRSEDYCPWPKVIANILKSCKKNMKSLSWSWSAVTGSQAGRLRGYFYLKCFSSEIVITWGHKNQNIYIFKNKIKEKFLGLISLRKQNEHSNANKRGYIVFLCGCFQVWSITDATWFLRVGTKQLVKGSSQHDQLGCWRLNLLIIHRIFYFQHVAKHR